MTEQGTVLITGSSGFLGQSMAKRLLERWRVVGLDMAQPKTPLPGMETVEVDLTSDESTRTAVEKAVELAGGRIASVVHLAGYYDLTGEPDPKYEAVTVQGTRRLFDALVPHRPEQFVFASTMLVHAPTEPGHPIDEDSPVAPKTPYPQSKVDTEELLKARHGDVPIVLLRPAGVYDDMCRAAFLAQQIANIYEKQFVSYVYPGDPAAGQPYVHIEDLTDAVFRTVERRRDLPTETTLLLGETRTMGYDEVQRRVGRLLHGEAWETHRVPKALAKVGQWVQEDVLQEDPFIQPWMIDQSSDHFELDIGRARDLLGWTPRHSLRETLTDMTAALKADPPGWYAANKLNPAKVAADDAALERSMRAADRETAARLPAVEGELQAQAKRTRWAHFVNIALGAWLITSPFTYGLFDPVTAVPPPAAGHDLAPPEIRNLWLGISEIASGLALMVLGLVALRHTRSWAQWAMAAVGFWVLFAPLLVWTPSAAAYAMDTLVGSLVIVLAVMVAPQPGIAQEALASRSDCPVGWSYSPSTYTQRIPIVALAFIGLFVSRYLAAYQMGHIDSLWDPFFASNSPNATNGTEAVVTSSVSRAFPIPDAGLGAIAYLLDILTGAIGDRRRWRTMPWIVLIFGLLIVPLGVVSVGFIIIQPPVIGALCALCLIQAAITLIMIPYAVDEVGASLQYLLRARRAGQPFWRTLMRGGPALSEARDETVDLDLPLTTVLRNFLAGGVNYPWPLNVCVAVGLVLIAAPLLVDADQTLLHSHHIAGCIAVSMAVIAMAEVSRIARFLNLPVGLWVAASPFLLGGAPLPFTVLSVIAGGALILLSLPRGKVSGEHYGGWDRFIV